MRPTVDEQLVRIEREAAALRAAGVDPISGERTRAKRVVPPLAPRRPHRAGDRRCPGCSAPLARRRVLCDACRDLRARLRWRLVAQRHRTPSAVGRDSAGLAANGVVPYGFRGDAAQRAEERGVLEIIFRLASPGERKRCGISAILAALAEAGVPPPRGGTRWRRASVGCILNNDAYRRLLGDATVDAARAGLRARMRNKRIHYAGEIRTRRVHVLPGWAACCSGPRAERLRGRGATTRDRAEVTCLRCLRMITMDAEWRCLYYAGPSRDQP